MHPSTEKTWWSCLEVLFVSFTAAFGVTWMALKAAHHIRRKCKGA